MQWHHNARWIQLAYIAHAYTQKAAKLVDAIGWYRCRPIFFNAIQSAWQFPLQWVFSNITTTFCDFFLRKYKSNSSGYSKKCLRWDWDEYKWTLFTWVRIKLSWDIAFGTYLRYYLLAASFDSIFQCSCFILKTEQQQDPIFIAHDKVVLNSHFFIGPWPQTFIICYCFVSTTIRILLL